jgi:hypothetical protein
VGARLFQDCVDGANLGSKHTGNHGIFRVFAGPAKGSIHG